MILLSFCAEPHFNGKVIAIACSTLCQVDNHAIHTCVQRIVGKSKRHVLIVQIPTCSIKVHVAVARQVFRLCAHTFTELPVTNEMLGRGHLGFIHLRLKVRHINRFIPKCYLVDSTCESVTQCHYTVAFIPLDRQFISKAHRRCITGIQCRETRIFTLLVEAECQVNPLVGRESMLRITHLAIYAEVVVTLYLLHTKRQLGLSVAVTEDRAFATDSCPHVNSETLTDKVDVGLSLSYSAFAARSLECHIVSHCLTVQCSCYDEVTRSRQASTIDIFIEG